MRFLITIVLVNIYLHSLFAQIPEHAFIGYKGEKEINISEYLVKYEKELYDKYQGRCPNSEWLKEYVNNLIANEIADNKWGSNYTNWKEATDYINEIVKVTLKEKWTPNCVAVISRNQEVNAYMIENGKIYINVGLLAFVNSEAELASIIAHEYGHYISEHHFKDYINTKSDKEKIQTAILIPFPGSSNIVRKTTKEYFQRSQEDESEADDIALKTIFSSEYSLLGNVNVFKGFLEEENKYKKQVSYKSGRYYQTHPATKERLKKAEGYRKDNEIIKKKEFIVSEQRFNLLKQKAIDECIYYHFRDMEFYPSMVKCYKELLSKPYDEFYLFYLIESIRRYLHVNPEKQNSNFITDFYNVNTKSYSKDKWPKYYLCQTNCTNISELNNIIQYQHLQLLFNNDSISYKRLAKNHLTKSDTIEFITNKEAYDYFQEQLNKVQPKLSALSKFLNGISVPIEALQSLNPAFENFNEVIQYYIKAKDTITITAIPLRITYENNMFSFLQKKDDISDFATSVMSNFTSDFTYPGRVINLSEQSLDNKVTLFDLGISMQRFGAKFDELEKAVKNPKREPIDITNSVNVDIVSLYPELSPYLSKNQLEKCIFYDIEVAPEHVQAQSLGIGPMMIPVGKPKKMIVIKAFYFDCSKKVIHTNYRVVKGVYADQTVAKTSALMSDVAELLSNN